MPVEQFALAYIKVLRKKPDAEEWRSRYEAEHTSYPTRIVELEFGTVDDEI